MALCGGPRPLSALKGNWGHRDMIMLSAWVSLEELAAVGMTVLTVNVTVFTVDMTVFNAFTS